MKGKKRSGQAQASRSNVDAPMKNHFYGLPSSGEQECSPNVVTGMLQVFSIDVYALLYPGTTLYFVTPLISRKFDIFPDDLNDPFVVITSVGEGLVDFDVILGMDWFHDCFSSINCRIRILKINIPNEPVSEWKGRKSIPRGRIISFIRLVK